MNNNPLNDIPTEDEELMSRALTALRQSREIIRNLLSISESSWMQYQRRAEYIRINNAIRKLEDRLDNGRSRPGPQSFKAGG